MLLIAALLIVTTFLPSGDFPDSWRLPISGPADTAVAWMRDNLDQIGGLPIGTKPFSDFLTLSLLDPVRALLRDALPWTVVMLALAALAYWVGSWRLALFTLAGLFLIGLLVCGNSAWIRSARCW